MTCPLLERRARARAALVAFEGWRVRWARTRTRSSGPRSDKQRAELLRQALDPWQLHAVELALDGEREALAESGDTGSYQDLALAAHLVALAISSSSPASRHVGPLPSGRPRPAERSGASA